MALVLTTLGLIEPLMSILVIKKKIEIHSTNIY